MNQVAPAKSGGFTYLLLLVLIALFGAALAAVSTVWATYSQRDKEEELIFVGRQFSEALRAYNLQNQNVGDGFPKQLENLLLDPSTPTVRRFLRKIYLDPMTGKAEWGLIKTPSGTIRGVYSLSGLTPIRTVLPPDLGEVANAKSYSDWKFAVMPGQPQPSSAANAPPVAAPGVPLPVPEVNAPTPGGPSPAAAAPAAPQQPDAKQRRCEMIVQSDQGACEALDQRYGQRASLPCLQSADQRRVACQTDAQIPPLVTNIR